jgi:hypothetical protein
MFYHEEMTSKLTLTSYNVRMHQNITGYPVNMYDHYVSVKTII